MAADDNVHEGDGDPDGDDADGSSHGSRTLTTFISAQRGRAMSPEQQIRKECGFSQGISTISKPTRLQITRAYLADAFAVAFDLALYTLCTDLMGRGYRECPLDLRATETPLRSTLNDLAGTPADRLLISAKRCSIPSGSNCRPRKASPRSRPCWLRRNSTSSPGASG